MNINHEQKRTVEKIMKIDADNKLFWDEKKCTPKFMMGRLSVPTMDDPEVISRNFIAENKDLWNIQTDLDETLIASDTVTDTQGHHHVSFLQTLNGLPVFEGSVQVHMNNNGEVVTYKDNRISSVEISFEPTINKDIAIDRAIDDLNEKKARIESEAELQLFRDNEKRVHLAWAVELLLDSELDARNYFVDAHSGVLLYKYSQVREAMSRLTYSASNRPILPGNLILQDEQMTDDEVAQAAHSNIEKVYQYYKNTLGRDSYDGQGGRLVSTVHFRQRSAEPYNNAFWSSRRGQMVYGDGDGTRFAPLAFALDIVGHELTHAVASETAKFVYAEQSGALDESFADFFGVMISSQGPVVDWEVGEGVYTPYRYGDALRDMADPSKYRQPEHMDDYMALAQGELPDSNKNDNGYVHSNSGIPNKAAYLICEGGRFHGIQVQGISREKTEQIYYLALSEFLRSATASRWTFLEARRALLNACHQRYGNAGVEYAAIKNAWAAVGVGEPSKDFSVIEKTVSPATAIPDNDPAGISSIVNVSEQGVVKNITVDLNIEHSYIGDLRVLLISPAGEVVMLHDREGGSSDNIKNNFNIDTLPALNAFISDQIQGDWTLRITDSARIDTGTLVSWGLKFAVQKAEKQIVMKEALVNLPIPDNEAGGIESVINFSESGTILAMSIAIDITHSWKGDLIVSLIQPSGDEIILHNRTGGSRNDIVKTYSTKTDQVMLPMIGQEINGSWALKVADYANQDVGKLNKWGIDVVYE